MFTQITEFKPLQTRLGLRLWDTVKFVFMVFALGTVSTGIVSAQQNNDPQIPSGTPPSWEAGQIQQHIGEQVPELNIPVPIFDDDQRRVLPDNVEELSLTLNEIVIEGSTVYSDDDFAYLYENLIGKEIPLAKVFDIADMITAKYRNDGYILSRAIVPPQTIETGTVRIKIVEGYIDEVSIQGDMSEQSSLLNAYAENIVKSRPLSINVLERYMLFIRDLPGVEAEATISPSRDTPGASDLVILVDYKAKDGFVRFDNRGSKFNGPGQVWLGAGFNSLADTHQRNAFIFATTAESTKELKYFDFGYERHIDADGKKLYLNLTKTESQPGASLAELDIDSGTESFKIGVSKPIIRSRGKNLSLYADFVARNSETTILTSRLSKDRVRFFSVGALYDSIDRFGGVNQLGIRIDQGLDTMSASKEGSTNLSRQGGNTDFTKLWLSASRLQRINENWSFLTSFSSQFASSKLLASEEFGVGGERCVRGFDPSEVTGDHGYCFLLEMRYGQNSVTESLAGYQLYGFYDVGAVKRKPPGALGGKTASLASAGLGVRLNFEERLSGSLEVAWPQKKGVDARKIDVDANRIFFGLTARF